jgi:hypothetical protein
MTAALATTESLSRAEQIALDDCEERIQRGLKTFVEVGSALAFVNENRLYRTTHDSFESYARGRWNLSRTRSYAARAARQERRTWTDNETSTLRKQFAQPALSPALELDAMVPLGDGTAVRFGDMNRVRIAARKDMRLRVHVDELRAFETEMTHWLHTEPLLGDGETIEDAIERGDTA